jgi:Cu2+-exporting ATPase
VHAAIGALELGEFYAQPRPAGAPAKVSGRGFEEFDDASFLKLYGRGLAGGLIELELVLEGVHCASCVWLVERLPRAVPGLASIELDLRRRLARARFDPRALSPAELARALDRLGYAPHPFRSAERAALRQREERRQWIRLGIAGALFGNAMLIAFALYGGAFAGMETAQQDLLRWFGSALTLASVFGPGLLFHRGALAALRLCSVHMDVPVSLALSIGSLWGLYNTATGQGEVYFESLTAVVFLLLIGRTVQGRHERQAADQVELLFSLAPQRARRIDGGVEREVPVSALCPGDLVALRAGDVLPADGRIERGSGRLDLSLLTGESRPIEVGPGALVSAGTTLLDAPLEVRVTAVGAGTRLSKLVARIVDGAAERPRLVRLADRVARRFVAAILVLAGLTLLLWWPVGPDEALEHAIALLIVTCPCALGLATPLAIQAAIGRAARAGLLIKSGEVLERLGGPAGTALFDKTGTLTEAQASLATRCGDPTVLARGARLEACSGHLLARAVAAGLGVDPGLPAPQEVREIPGRGLIGLVDGRRLAVGNRQLAEAEGALLGADWLAEERRLLERGETPVWMVEAGSALALVGLAQRLRPEAGRALAELEALGWRVEVISGDRAALVRRAAQELGIEPARARGELGPEEKLAAIRAARERGPVLMVGDGVNDAAALAHADVGVALSGAAEASLEAADVYLSGTGLAGLPALVRGSRATLAALRRNVLASLAYNLVAGGLAIAGLIHPVIAAILMPLSSLTVITLSWRARTFAAPEATEANVEPRAGGGAEQASRAVTTPRGAVASSAGGRS